MQPKTYAIRVWDLPTRLFHWTLVVAFGALFITASTGNMEAHGRIGVFVLVLLEFRLIWGVVGSQTARFSDFLVGIRGIKGYLLAGKVKTLGHNPLGGLMVILMLAALLVQVSLGLFANDGHDYNGPLAHLTSASFSDTLSELHEDLAHFLLAAIFVHIGAVIFHGLLRKENLLYPMFTGLKRVSEIPARMNFQSSLTALAVILVVALNTAVLYRLLSVAG